MKRKRPLNDMGIWLMQELNYRDIRRKEFADMIQTTPQNLSDIMRGNRFSTSTLQRWKVRFENALTDIDEKRGINPSPTTVYQAICTTVIIEGNTYTAYGSTTREDILVGAYLLLGQQRAAEIHFSRLTPELQNSFKSYPIYRFWNENR